MTKFNVKENIIKFRDHYNKDENYFRYMFIIFLCASTGFISSFVGSLLGLFSVKIDVFFLYLTNLSNLMVMIYYGIKSLSFKLQNSKSEKFSNYNKKLYKNVSTLNIHGFMTVFMALVLIMIILVLAPLSAAYNIWGINPGAVNPENSNKESIIGAVISNTFVHGVTPVVIILDFFLIKRNKKEVEKFTYKSTMVWTSVMAMYSFYTLAIGDLIRRYPYTIIDPNVFGWWVIFFSLLILFIFLGIKLFLVKMTKKLN